MGDFFYHNHYHFHFHFHFQVFSPEPIIVLKPNEELIVLFRAVCSIIDEMADRQNAGEEYAEDVTVNEDEDVYENVDEDVHENACENMNEDIYENGDEKN